MASEKGGKERLVGGLLFDYVVDFVRKRKGEGAVSALEKKLGLSIFDQRRMYPVDAFIQLQREAVRAVFGDETDDGYKKLGRHVYDAYAHTLVGATLSTTTSLQELLGKKFRELGGLVVSFGSRKLLELDEAQGVAIIQIGDDPRNPAYLQGVLEVGLEMVHLKNFRTVVFDKTGDSYKIKITWQTGGPAS